MSNKFVIFRCDADGMRTKEEPRRMISADGKHKSLMIGNGTVLATTAYDAPDDDLWAAARDKVDAQIAAKTTAAVVKADA